MLYRRKLVVGLTFFNYRTILPVNLAGARDPIGKSAFGQWSTSQIHMTSISRKLEPAIWTHDNDQWIPCFDRCQLIKAWMSNIKEVDGKPGKGCTSLSTYFFGVWPPSS